MADRILIIEDEEKIARYIELELSHEGYEVAKRADGCEGLEEAQRGGYDLILLDIMLPGLNGLEVLRRLRKTSGIPVILLTARDAVMDKVSGLDLGADDYITKPFAIEELLARIRLAMRHKEQTKPSDELTAGKLSVFPAKREVRYGGDVIELSAKEFDLLHTLVMNKNIVMSRDTLLNEIWGYDYFGETNVVDVYIRHLRSKLDDVYGAAIISTVRSVGYVIKD